MSDRKLPAILAIAAGGAVLAAAGAWFLRGPEGPGTGASPEAPPGAPAEQGPPAPPDLPAGHPPLTPSLPPPSTKVWARVRIVDEVTRLPVPFVRGSHVHLAIAEGGRSHLAPLPFLRNEEGRWLLAWPYDGSNDPRKGYAKAAADAATVQVRVPGYAPIEFPLSQVGEDRERAMRPVPPSARGEFQGGPGAMEGTFSCDLLPNPKPGDPAHVPAAGMEAGPPVLPDRLGSFRIHDIPPGRWRLHARVAVGTGTAEAIREFEVKEGTTDLGVIPLLAPVTVRARVVGRDGSGVLDADLRITRAGEGADLPSAGAPAPDKEGWVEFPGLEAGVEYVVTASRFEGLKRTVHAPAEGGQTVSVELSTELQGVLCRIRFTVNGQDPVKWGDIVDGPSLDDGAWKKDGRLEQEMAAGEYGFVIQAQPVGKDKLVPVRGTFTVPEGKRDWEKTVDLREGE